MTEILVKIIDEASQSLSNIHQNAETAFAGVESAAAQSSAGLDNVSAAAEQTGAAMDSVSGASLDEAAASAEGASASLETAATSADQAGAAAEGISDQAINQAASSATALGGSFDEAAMAADQAGAATESISDQAINQAASSASALGSGLDEVSNSADEAAEKTEQIGTAAQNAEETSLTSMASITLGLGAMTAGLEASAREANNTNATFEKMASVKFPEEQLRSMVANLTNVKFPLQDALLYIRTLRQAGITSIEAQEAGAKAFNTIAVGAGVSSDEVVKFSNSMVAMGMDLNNIPASFNAIAYANGNMIGGFSTLINWLQKYDSTFHEMGLNIDQAAVLVSAATKKFGGGRAAYTGLNEAIKESSGDLSVLEEKLGMQPGALANASAETEKYSGKLEKNAQISREHTTIIEQTTAWLEDLSTKYGDLIGSVGSVGGALGGLTSTITAVSTAKMAFTSTLGVETAAENTSTLAKIRSRAADIAGAAATAIRTQATAIQTGMTASSITTLAAMTGATNVNTASQNAGAVTYIRATASLIAQRVAMVAGTVATNAAAMAQQALNLIMSMNPIMIVVLAVVALVAILWHLYNTNETVRGAIDGLWKGLQALGAYIWGGLVAAWNALTSALQPITDALGRLGGAIFGRLMQAWNSLVKAIQPVITAIQEFFASLSGGASSGAGDIFNQIGSAIMWVWSVIEPFVNTVLAGLSAMLQTIVGIISGIITFIATFINALADLIAGNITFEQFMQQIWGAVQMLFWTVIGSILTGIGKFALDLVNKGVKAAQDFLNGIVTWITQLPGKMWALLLLVISKTLAWRNQMIARAKEVGSNFINNVISFIQTLPGRVWTWLLNTIAKLSSFVSQAGAKARQAGSTIISNIADFLTGLPGKMWDWGSRAIQSFIDSIINAIPGLRGALDMVASLFPRSPPKEGPLSEVTEQGMYKYGESLGKSFAEGVNDTTSEVFSDFTPPTGPFDIPTPVSSPASGAMAATTPTQPVTASVGLDTTALAEGNQQAQGIVAGTVQFASEEYGLMQTNVATAWQGMATTTQTGFQGIQTNMQSTLTQIVANNQAGYTQLKNNTASTVTAMVTSNKNSYNTMQKNMSNTLTAITNDNKSKYTSILNTTKTTLNTLQSKTNDSMGQVKTSWNGMRNSLISAASQVRSQTTNEINRLSGNIAVFYRKIQNPAMLLAGPVPSRYRNKPWWTHPVGGRAGGFAGPGISNKEIRRLDTSPGIPCDTWYDCHFAGSWDYSDPWIQEIMSIVHGYRPSFYDMGSLGLKVGDFENSTWPVTGNMQLFDALAAKIVGRSHYSFYYDSNGLSPYQNAMNGAYNCWDGAMIMIALANALGLPAYMAHGYWGNIGHVWAVVNGQTRDTTAFQGGYGWSSPKVHAGPGPKTFSGYDTSSSSDKPLVVEERITVDYNWRFPDGVPEGIDERELARLMKENADDPEFIRALVKNRGFQDRLDVEIKRHRLRVQRSRGS